MSPILRQSRKTSGVIPLGTRVNFIGGKNRLETRNHCAMNAGELIGSTGVTVGMARDFTETQASPCHMSTPTPRTDAIYRTFNAATQGVMTNELHIHAIRLEQELTAALAERDQIKLSFEADRSAEATLKAELAEENFRLRTKLTVAELARVGMREALEYMLSTTNWPKACEFARTYLAAMTTKEDGK